VAAVPYRLLGGGAGALGLVAIALNAAGIVVLLRFAGRLGRAPWYAVAAALVALVAGLSPDALASVWNVTITNVALLLFVVACWGVWCDVAQSGWIALVAGSFVMQSHVGTGVVIGPLAAATAGLVAWRWFTRDGRPTGDLVRTGLAVGLLWVVPVGLDALVDPPGNLARLVRWSLTHDEPQIGFGTAGRLLARTSSLTFVTEPRLARGVFLDIQTVELGLLPGLAVLLLGAAWFVAWRAGWHRELVWCSIVASLWVVGLVAAASITLPLGWWLVQWLEPLGWMTWSAIAVVGWRVVAERRPRLATAPALPAVALALLALGAAVHAVDVARSHEPTTVHDDTIRRLAEAVPPDDGAGPVAITTEGDPLLADATLAGVVAALDRRGVDTCVEPRLVDKFRAHRVCGLGVGGRLLLRLERTAAAPPAAAETLVVIDPFTPTQRDEIDRLTAELADVLRRDGRAAEIPVLATPLADVILLDRPSPELAARSDDARRLAELRSVPGDRYGLYELTVTPQG
jgi:MFS family permease